MELEKALKARRLLEDIEDASHVLTQLGSEPFKLVTTIGGTLELTEDCIITITPDIRQEIRDCLRDYKDRKQKELYAL